MNFNFEGNYKQKRAISLGGVKAQEDKRALLQKNQAQRRLREAERLRQRSATKMQSFYRGRHAASLVRHAERALFPSRLSSFHTLLAASTNSSDDLARLLVELVQLFLFFYREREDGAQAAELCDLLDTRVADGWKVVWVPFVAGGGGGGDARNELRKRWRWQIRRVLEIALARVGECVGRESTAQATPFLNLLNLATDPTTADRLHPVDPTLYPHLLLCLLRHAQLYYYLRRYLTSLTSPADKLLPTVATAVSVIISPLKYAQSAADPTLHAVVLDMFIKQILSISALPDHISVGSLAEVSVRLPFEKIVARVVEMEKEGGVAVDGGGLGMAGLLGNVLAFGHARVGKMSNKGLMSYLRVLQILLLRLPSTLLANEEDSTIAATNSGGTFSDDDDSSDEDGDAHMIDAPPLRSAPNPANTEPKLDPLLLRWLSLLHDPAHLASLLGYHLNRFPAPPSKSASASPIAKIANYLVTVMIRWSSSKDSLLAHLMYALPVPAGNGKGEVVGSGSVLRVLWETWKATSLGKKVLEVAASKGSGKVPVGVVFDFANAEDWAILVLLCEVFTRLLVTMGDDEFYGQRHGKNPLRLEEIIEMSGVLRDIAFMLHWNDASLKMESVLQGTCIKVTHLRTVVTKLTQHIHARDSRRPFCPTTHWLVSDLDVESFVRSVVEEEQALDHERELDLRFRRRHMSVASPRLAVLNQIPFVIPFEDRVQIFREFVANDRERTNPGGYFQHHQHGATRVKATVHRDNVLEDGFMQLNKLGPSLKSKIAISFIDKFGLAEEGIDGGGVFKEFLTALTKQAFDTNYGLFLHTPEHILYPNPHAYALESQQLAYFEFLGRVMGKALYEGILVDVPFAGFFLNKWLGKMNYLDDLPSLDPELYQGLISLKNYDGNVEDLALDFSITSSDFGKAHTIDLILGGRNIPVTNSNRTRYIYLMAHYRLNVQIDRQCKAFFNGLVDLIDPKWLRMFNQQELQILLGGASVPIDIDDLRANTVYSGFNETDPTIQNFWWVVSHMDNDQKRNFVKFVTSCSRPPLLGFKELNPKFCIRNAGQNNERLPTSSTCVNLLKLPAFSDLATLKKKLLYAINAEAGFDLS